mmetsp:Transcript_36372/g.104550  ORF Transcript_36372/g.104550 Transcript_36372/m.104550 type:complete len:1037 (+) Transcript_36372:111-3221(+)
MRDDIDIQLSEVSGALLEAELSHCLGLKGYCVLDCGLDEDVLEGATDEAVDLKRAGRFAPPPEQVIDGVLGPEGTRELAWLTPHDEAGYADGEHLRSVSKHLRMLSDSTRQFCSDFGIYGMPTRTLAVRGGEVTDEIVELTEDDCTQWMGTLVEAKLMLIYFLGPGEGSLELQPLDDESWAVEIPTRRGMIVVLRADTLLHRHVSSADDYSLVSWVKSLNTSGTRGWNEMDPAKVEAMPAVKELHQWMQQRLQAIVDLEVEEKLDGGISRDWLKLAHHSFFRKDKNPVAVRGDAGHLPGAWDPEAFWSSLNVGIDYLTQIPAMRWDHNEYYDPEPDSWMKSLSFRPPTYIRTNVRHGTFIEGCELFDTKFFGISVMEAKGMDPMQKHILETSYEALHAAGYKKKELMNNYIAVFTGASNPEWNYIDREAGACSGTGSSQAITSNRTSFALGMMGPSSSIDCEMSSASVALMVGSAAVSTTNARRVESAGNSSAAVVGGVFLAFTPFMWPRYNCWMNPIGRCLTFDQSANGYVRGEMCGSVCLKPYAEKVDKDLVIADQPCVGCITGWRMISNGRAASLTAPHGPAEQECVFDALRDASIDALDVDGVECHGAGGLLDDSVEVTSLAAVLRGMTGGEKEALVLGSVKTHVGAQCEACGMAQLLKLLYNIGYANNSPSVHLKTLNPHIDLGESAVMINNESLAYRGRSAFHGFSSRGLGGTMVHGIVWYHADERKVRVNQSRRERQVFNFWPGGGGVLEAGRRPAHGYYIVGSWGQWEQVDEMAKTGDGSYTFTVTLGVNRFESFQIWLDGDDDRILHPSSPSAPSGSVVSGPSEPQEAEGLRWMIDGRAHPWAVAEGEGQGALQAESRDEMVTRDQGNVGDQYEVKLLIAGKYRAVSWQKVRSGTIRSSGDLVPYVAGKYYFAGAWNGWAFEEMVESPTGPGIYTADVTLGFGSREFVVLRNKDWQQVFCPSSLAASRTASGGEVVGPVDLSSGLTWSLDGRSGESFVVEFQRSFEDGQDLRLVSWRRKELPQLPGA